MTALMRILSWPLVASLYLLGGCSAAPSASQQFSVRELVLPRSDGDFVKPGSKDPNQLGRILGQVQTLLAHEGIDLQHFFDVSPSPIELEVGSTGVVLVTERGYVPFIGTRQANHLSAHASQPVTLSVPSLGGLAVTFEDAVVELDLDDTQPWLTGAFTGRLTTRTLRTSLSPPLATLINDHLASEPNSTLSTQLRALFDTGCSTDADPEADGQVSACEVAEEPLLWSLLHSDAISAGLGLFAVQHQ